MNTIDIKNSLHKSIENIDDEVILNAVYEMILSYTNDTIVGNLGNNRLTQVDLINREN